MLSQRCRIRLVYIWATDIAIPLRREMIQYALLKSIHNAKIDKVQIVYCYKFNI